MAMHAVTVTNPRPAKLPPKCMHPLDQAHSWPAIRDESAYLACLTILKVCGATHAVEIVDRPVPTLTMSGKSCTGRERLEAILRLVGEFAVMEVTPAGVVSIVFKRPGGLVPEVAGIVENSPKLPLNAAMQGLLCGYLTLNESLAIAGQPPIPGGDAIMMPMRNTLSVCEKDSLTRKLAAAKDEAEYYKLARLEANKLARKAESERDTARDQAVFYRKLYDALMAASRTRSRHVACACMVVLALAPAWPSYPSWLTFLFGAALSYVGREVTRG